MTDIFYDSISATLNDSGNLVFNVNHSKETVEHFSNIKGGQAVRFEGAAETGLRLVRCEQGEPGSRKINLSKDSKTKQPNGKGKTAVPSHIIGFPNVKFKAIKIGLTKIPKGIKFPPLTEETLIQMHDDAAKQMDPVDLDSVDETGLDPNNTAGQMLEITEDQVDDRLRREIERLENSGRPGIDESMDNLEEALRGKMFKGKFTVDGKFEIKI